MNNFSFEPLKLKLATNNIIIPLENGVADLTNAETSAKIMLAGKELFPDVDDRIEGINLMKGTADFDSKYWEKASGAIEFDLDPSVKMVETVSDYTTAVSTPMAIQGWNFTIGQEFVVSVWARTDLEDGSMIGLTAQTVNVQPQFVGSEWKLYKWYFKSTNDALVLFRFTTPARKPVWIAKINVQRGNKIGDWTPAPEDVLQLASISSYNCSAAIVDDLIKITSHKPGTNKGWVDVTVNYGNLSNTKRLNWSVDGHQVYKPISPLTFKWKGIKL